MADRTHGSHSRLHGRQPNLPVARVQLLRQRSLRLRHIDQDETRCREIEGCSGQPSGSSITLHHVDIPEVALRNELSGEGESLRAPLDSHDAPRRANPLGEEIETTVRPAADLDDALAAGYRYLIKQPARFMRELLRLLLQPLLLRLPVAKNVLVGLGHDESSHRSRAAELTVDRGAEGHAGGEHEPCRPAVAL